MMDYHFTVIVYALHVQLGIIDKTMNQYSIIDIGLARNALRDNPN